MTDYIVIVYPAPPATRGESSVAYSYSHHQPHVKMVTASSPEKAADMAKVPPGGHAFVAERAKAHRFDRAKEAPLVAVQFRKATASA